MFCRFLMLAGIITLSLLPSSGFAQRHTKKQNSSAGPRKTVTAKPDTGTARRGYKFEVIVKEGDVIGGLKIINFGNMYYKGSDYPGSAEGIALKEGHVAFAAFTDKGPAIFHFNLTSAANGKTVILSKSVVAVFGQEIAGHKIQGLSPPSINSRGDIAYMIYYGGARGGQKGIVINNALVLNTYDYLAADGTAVRNSDDKVESELPPGSCTIWELEPPIINEASSYAVKAVARKNDNSPSVFQGGECVIAGGKFIVGKGSVIGGETVGTISLSSYTNDGNVAFLSIGSSQTKCLFTLQECMEGTNLNWGWPVLNNNHQIILQDRFGNLKRRDGAYFNTKARLFDMNDQGEIFANGLEVINYADATPTLTQLPVETTDNRRIDPAQLRAVLGYDTMAGLNIRHIGINNSGQVAFQAGAFKGKNLGLIVLGTPTNYKPVESSAGYSSLTVYFGGAGMNGPYISDQVIALKAVGVKNVVAGNYTAANTLGSDAGQYADVLFTIAEREDAKGVWDLKDMGIEDDWAKTINLIGYSYGSIVAAHVAQYYTSIGRKIGILVLIGSPIGDKLLTELRKDKNIQKVIVINLAYQGDPLFAGMSDKDVKVVLEEIAVKGLKATLGDIDTGTGHFYYGVYNDEGKKRRRELAKNLWDSGLR